MSACMVIISINGFCWYLFFTDDHNRVVLSSMAECSGIQNEYINASYIDVNAVVIVILSVSTNHDKHSLFHCRDLQELNSTLQHKVR